MNASVSSSDLLTIEPKQFVEITYKPFSQQLEEAIAKLPILESDLNTHSIDSKSGMEVAKEGRALFREIRITLEKKRAAAKAPIIEIGRLLDSRAKEIVQQIEPHEARFDKVIKAEEQRIADEKAAKAKAEQEKQEKIQYLIDDIRNSPITGSQVKSSQLEEMIADLRKYELTEADFGDRVDEAEFVRTQALQQMEVLLAGKKAQEQLAKQLEEQRIEQERKARELEEQQAAEATRQREELEKERERQRVQSEALEEQRIALEEAQAKVRAELDAIERAKQQKEQHLRDAEISMAREQEERDRLGAVENQRITLEAAHKIVENSGESIMSPEVKRSIVTAGGYFGAMPEDRYPGNDEIIGGLADYFDVSEAVATDWLQQYAQSLTNQQMVTA